MDKQEVIDYLIYTPYNTNLAVLKSMLGDGDWNELLDYVKRTSYRMNKHVLDGLLGASSKKDTIVLLDNTYTFNEVTEMDFAMCEASLSKRCTFKNIIITIDGNTAVIPKTKKQTNTDTTIIYGDVDSQFKPLFDTYPAVVLVLGGSNTMVQIAFPTAGEHAVKIEIPVDSETDDGDEGDESDDYIVLLNGTYTFEQIPIGAQYITTLEKSYNPTSMTVTIDGVTVKLPKVEGSTYPTYGEINENHRPTFDNYPVLITINNDTHQLAIAASETGSHTIKITVPNGSEVVM